jgi:SAM-dependent methyltransferase
MPANTKDRSQELAHLYAQRFTAIARYRKNIWQILTRSFFQQYISPTARILDVGCGYGEFINQIEAAQKFAIDLNPSATQHLLPDVRFFLQDCSATWPLPDASLDAIFSSNFFEHLPDKASLSATLKEAYRCLVPGGRIIAMGPNIRYIPGLYWDFWDHSLCLTEHSLAEGMRSIGFKIHLQIPRFLPYTMADGRQYPLLLLKLYLRLPLLWRVFGKQFIVIAQKP